MSPDTVWHGSAYAEMRTHQHEALCLVLLASDQLGIPSETNACGGPRGPAALIMRAAGHLIAAKKV